MDKFRVDVRKAKEKLRNRDVQHPMNTMRSRCKRFNRETSLTDAEVKQLRENPCIYCGGKLPLYGLGLDRLDNSKGYERGNCVPCCTICNRIRGNNLTFKEMKFIMFVLKFYRECKNDNQCNRLLNWISIFQ